MEAELGAEALTFLVPAAAVFLMCSSAGAAGSRQAAPPDFEIRTDPRFELLAVVSMLAHTEKLGSGFFLQRTPYVQAAGKHFRPFSGHPVVGRYRELTRQGFDSLSSALFVFHLQDPPGLELKEQLPNPLLRLLGGLQGFERFRAELSDFARISGFLDFYSRQSRRRRRLVHELEDQASALDVRGELQRYTGMNVSFRHAIIVSPFADSALGNSLTGNGPDGGDLITSVYGPESIEGKVQFRLKTRIGGLWAEMMTALLRGTGARGRAGFERSARLFSAVAERCAVDWPACAQRHIAFAVGARLLDRHGDPAGAAEWPSKYARMGLPYLAPLVERLKEYESRRDLYPTLMDFYPNLLACLEGLSARSTAPPPFPGGIPDLLVERGPLVLILSSGDRSLVESALRLWPQAQVLTPEEALKADLTAKTLVVRGTLQNNSWLARYYRELNLPMRFETGRIVFNSRPGEEEVQEYRGRLGLISAALNPFDESRGVLLLAASSVEAVPDFEAFLDGAPRADFVLLDGGERIKVAIYEKSRRPWRLK